MEYRGFAICVTFLVLSVTANHGKSNDRLFNMKPMAPLMDWFKPHNPQQCNITTPESNKAKITKLYDEVLGAKNVSTIGEYFANDTLEHNPYVADGLEARRLTLINGTISGAPVTIEIQRITADGDYVWVHSKFPIPNLNSTFAVVDIFRFECGLIHEHWDVLQNTQLAFPSLNPHPFF